MNSIKKIFTENVKTIDGHFSIIGKHNINDVLFLSSNLKNPYHKLILATNKPSQDSKNVDNVIIVDNYYDAIPLINNSVVSTLSFVYINEPSLTTTEMSYLIDSVFRLLVSGGIIVIENKDVTPQDYLNHITNSSMAGVEWFIRRNLTKIQVLNFLNKIIILKL